MLTPDRNRIFASPEGMPLIMEALGPSSEAASRRSTSFSSTGAMLFLVAGDFPSFFQFRIELTQTPAAWATSACESPLPNASSASVLSSSGYQARCRPLCRRRFKNAARILARVLRSPPLPTIFSLLCRHGRRLAGRKNGFSRIKRRAYSDSQFEITLKEPTPALLFLLRTPEMGIVPKEACDSEGKVVNLS